MNPFNTAILSCAATALIALTGCGGGGGSLAGTGGIGGTGVRVAGVGVGTTTGFGSIIINDVRQFTIDSQTRILRDGEEISEAELQLEGAGFATHVEIGEDVSPDFTSGTAVTIAVDNNVKGPVTSIAPLTVLGQNIVTTGDTLLAGLTDINALALSEEVEVSGFSDDNNVIQDSPAQPDVGEDLHDETTGVLPSLGGGCEDRNVVDVEETLRAATHRRCTHPVGRIAQQQPVHHGHLQAL